MADFDNITGWYEEFHGLLNSGEINAWKKRKSAESDAFSNPMPVGLARKYVELVLRNPEILDVARAHITACSKHPNMSEHYASTGEIPEEVSVLFDKRETFERWFVYKADYFSGQVSAPCSLLDTIAIDIQDGGLTDFEDPRVLDRLRDQRHPGFEFLASV